MPWLKTNAACKNLGVHENSLRKWADTGKIKCKRTPGGMRLYDVESVVIAGGEAAAQPVKTIKIAYCRVSSAKQKDDLSRQVAYMRERCPDHEIVTDVGSGINFKRKGLRSILEKALKGDLQEVCVSHRDRLCRFGFDLIKWLLERSRVELVVLNNENTSPPQEFTEDLLAIVTLFSCRFNGLRRYATAAKKAVEETEDGNHENGGGAENAENPNAFNEGASEDDVRVDGDCQIHVQQELTSGKKRKVSHQPKRVAGQVRHGKKQKTTNRSSATVDGEAGQA